MTKINNVQFAKNAKLDLFVQAYLTNGFNAFQATISAGYSEASAAKQSHELINDPRVQARLDAEFKRRQNKYKATVERTIDELSNIAFLDIIDIFDEDGKLRPVGDIPERARRAIAGIEVSEIFTGFGDAKSKIGELKKVKLCSKEKALELIGRHLKMFVDKLEVSADESFAELILKCRKRKEPQIDVDFLS